MKTNHLRYFIFLILIFLLISCGNNKSELTIPEEKLLEIFFDLHAAENIINRASANERDSLSMVYRDQIFKIHNVDKKEFEKNLKVLQSDPDRFKEFYEKLNKYGDQLLEKEKNNAKD